MRRIIAVNRFYWPSEAATSQLLTDLANRLASDGADVHVVTGRRVAPGADAALPRREENAGVTIHRVWSSMLGGASIVGRAIDYLTFYLAALWALFRLVRPGDRLLIKTDPPLMSVPAALVAVLRRARMIVWHQDIFPETAEAIGVVRRRGVLSNVARALRNRSLRRAEMNVVICDAMAETLLRQGTRPERIRVIPNWSDASLRPVAPDANPLRREWALQDKFVVGYSGNLGRVHQVESVAELVRLTHDIDGLVWLFVGGGVGADRIRALQQEIGAASLLTRPAQPREALSNSLSVPDVHLVSLDPTCEGLVMPSKLYGAMAAGRAVLNLGAGDGAVAQVIARHGIGVTIDPSQPERWHDTVAGLAQDRARLAEMGQRARQLFRAHYAPEKCLAEWQYLLRVPGMRPDEVRGREHGRDVPAEQLGGAG